MNPPTDTGACGEPRGMNRHRRKNEKSCSACKRAVNDYQRKRQGLPDMPDKPLTLSAQDLIEEIEFFLSISRGQHEILNAIGNPKPDALKNRLQRHGRHDLIPRIYHMDQIGVWAA